MGKPKLFITDLDGTLLSPDGSLSEDNIRAISDLTRHGCRVVPATGRTFGEIPDSIRNNPDIRYIITSNGAVTYDLLSGESFSSSMATPIALRVAEVMCSFDSFVGAHIDGECYVERGRLGMENLRRCNVPESYGTLFHDNTVKSDSLPKDIGRVKETEMIFGYFGNREDMVRCIGELRGIPEIKVTASAESSVEVISHLAGKENAVKRLLDLLGISACDAVIAGDSLNDLGMLSLTESSVAVKNAAPEVKAGAGMIGCSNAEGIAKFVFERFFDSCGGK